VFVDMTDRIDGRRLRYQHRRGELLEAVCEYVLDHGIASVSLRRVADNVGISHATLQHHFGTKDELVNEIVNHILSRTLAPLPVGSTPDTQPPLRQLWAMWTSPQGRRDIRLFLEIMGQSLYDEPGYTDAVRNTVDDRIGSLARTAISQGCPPAEAPAVATLILAQLRGMMGDLLVTNDDERIAAAFELLIEEARNRVKRWNAASPARVDAGADGARPKIIRS
jgi:AcrR family transcriptional regulator